MNVHVTNMSMPCTFHERAGASEDGHIPSPNHDLAAGGTLYVATCGPPPHPPAPPPKSSHSLTCRSLRPGGVSGP
jgi:hypothetical protein